MIIPLRPPRQRLAVPSHRELFLRLGRRLLYNTDGLFPSPINEDRAKINVKVATAEFEPKCGGRLYYVNDAKLGAHGNSQRHPIRDTRRK